MKVYTLEEEFRYEEDFGSFQYHLKLTGVYKTREEAQTAANASRRDNRIREWNV